REQRADHRAGAEIADKRQHDADTENGGENRQSLHACALRMLCLGAVVIPRPVQRPAGFAGNGGSGEQETASPPGAGAGGRSRRGHATQLTKNRMWRASSCMTGSNVSTSSGGKKRDVFAIANSPNAKKLSMHSLNPVTMNAHSALRGRWYSGSGASRIP